ncbi:MAG TPA: DUF1761 domain-containing protein [Gemmatimonadaceae bacterium]|nr:DUF1761 domain-containing protein [Gemmatimonadaceae bacterium]
MHDFPAINYLAVLVAAIVIFVLGGLWYSPVLFAKRWIALQNRTEEQMRAQAAAANMPLMYLAAFVCAFLQALVMSAVIGHIGAGNPVGVHHGAIIGASLWLGFAATTSYATALFSGKPKQLWLIDSMYNLVSFVLAGIILAVWR